MKADKDTREAWIQALLDGEDDDAARQALAGDAALQAELQAHQALRQALRGLGDAEPAPGFEDRVMGRVEAPGRWQAWRERLRAWALPAGLLAAGAAAAVLVVVGPPEGGSRTGEVGVSALAPAAAKTPTVTLRLRAGMDHWGGVRAALLKAGLDAPERPRTDGPVVVVEQQDVPVALVLGAVQELSARMPVEVSGLAAAAKRVHLRVVLGGM